MFAEQTSVVLSKMQALQSARFRAGVPDSGRGCNLSPNWRTNRGADRFLDFPDGQMRLNETLVAMAARHYSLFLQSRGNCGGVTGT